MELVSLELESLNELDFDIDLTGFSVDALSESSGSNNEIKEEEYNEVFNIIVKCSSEFEQESIYTKLMGDGYECQVQSL
jgi:predicted 3-demethylubiquinone-9 3-methyltransferase (glyoxalase superfamily)